MRADEFRERVKAIAEKWQYSTNFASFVSGELFRLMDEDEWRVNQQSKFGSSDGGCPDKR